MLDQLKTAINDVKFAGDHTHDIVSYVQDISGLELSKSSVLLSGLIFPQPFRRAMVESDIGLESFETFWNNLKFGMTVIWATDEIIEFAIEGHKDEKSQEVNDFTTGIAEEVNAIDRGKIVLASDSKVIEIADSIIDKIAEKFRDSQSSINPGVVAVMKAEMPEVIAAMLNEEKVYREGTYDEFLKVSATSNAIQVLGSIVACLLNENFPAMIESLQLTNEAFRILTDIMKLYKDIRRNTPNIVLKYRECEHITLEDAISQMQESVSKTSIFETIFTNQSSTVLFFLGAMKRMQNLVESPLGKAYELSTKSKVDIPPFNVNFEEVQRKGYEISELDPTFDLDKLSGEIAQYMASTADLTSYPVELVRKWLENERCFIAVDSESSNYKGAIILKGIENQRGYVQGYTIIGLNVNEHSQDGDIARDLFQTAVTYAEGKPVFVDSTNPLIHDLCERVGGARVDKYKRKNPLRILWEDSYKQIMNEVMSISAGKLALAIDHVFGYLRFYKFRAYVIVSDKN